MKTMRDPSAFHEPKEMRGKADMRPQVVIFEYFASKPLICKDLGGKPEIQTCNLFVSNRVERLAKKK